MNLKLKSMPLAVLQVVASGALSAAVVFPASAQQSQGADSGEVQRVVVTGSYISRADKETPSPVQVLTADDLKKTGYTSVSEALRDITANGQGTISQSFNRAFAGGASGISLRGLTVGATLVLIDGHRMAPYPLSDDGQRSFVDISNIPFDAIERIDILKDSASAAYGSDAIAGVVNVILKKEYKGTALSAEGGGTQAGGGRTVHVTATHGIGDVEADGYNVFGTIEYRKQDPIMLTQRAGKDWAKTNWTSEGGIDLTPGAVNAITPLPRTYQPYLYNPAGAGGAGNAANYAFYSGGCANYAALQANQCTFVDPWAQLQPKTENINVLAGFTKKLSDGWQLNVKASMLESKDSVESTPVAYPPGSYVGNTSIGPGIIPHQVGVISSFLVPANYPGNTTGAPARVYGYLTDIGARINDVDSKSYRLVAELTGNIGAWDVAAYAGYTKVETEQTYHGYVDRQALYNALNDPANPYKITGGNSADVNAKIAPVFSGKQNDELDFVDLRGTRTLTALPGGDLAISVGGTYIQKKLNAPAADQLSSGLINGNAAFVIGEEKNAAAYFELVAPVLKTLELDLSGRYDHFDTYGSSSTPKIGAKWSPSEMVTFRGTYGKGFRAPNAAENGTAGSTFSYNTIADPVLCANGPKGDPAKTVPQYCSFSPAYVQVTTKDLQPEKSKSGSFGMILEPVKGWSTTIDYYSIKIDNQIVTEASLPGYDPQYVRGTPIPLTYADGHTETPSVGPILYANSGYVNANSTKTTGVDLNSSYRFKMGEYGNLKVGLDWTHMISYTLTANGQDYQLAGTHGPTVISGDTGNPKNRAQLTLGYDKGPFNATATVNWIDSYSVLDPSTGGANDTCEDSLQNSNNYFANGNNYPTHYCRVSSFTSTNLNMAYKVNKNLTIRGSIVNLFDRQPPIDAQTYGGTSIASGTNAPYNPSLHQTGAVGRFFSLGANYTF
ncbi:TonB-dependent receptor [Duganella callida]|uniref:TonB-dependent receptor n=1 Tax=Duganella callida TaxID=2561932 RepID=A0A4Y9SAL5_9BURK|nr:TonB-dependent receptor [Duganella callida]TFW19094.1 TonB-dependent receptor [Duganella callida]